MIPDLDHGAFRHSEHLKRTASFDDEFAQAEFFRLGQQAEDLDKLEEAWKESLKQFNHAVDLDKADQDAAFNKAFVEERLKQIEMLRELARQAKAAADTATQQRNYRGALEIMTQLMQQAQAVAKPFEEFTKKLKDIDDIINPPSPQAPPGQP